MREISRFFGIIVRMYYDDHPPPHIHAEYQGKKAKIDFGGNVLLDDLRSKTALRLVREWIDLHDWELKRDWELARDGEPLVKVAPTRMWRMNDIRSARYVRDYVVHI
jgi:uncharacterized protein DUF4160